MGLWGSRYFLNRVGEVPLVIDELEDGIDGIVGFPRFFARQDGDCVGVADDQIIREAAVQVSSGAGEAVLYLF